jgi:hypothetical protein
VAPNWSEVGSTCSMDVIHQEKWVARQTRLRQVSEYASAACAWPSLSRLVRVWASAVTSARARLRPLAPVGGTMCAASPARNSRSYRMGEATKLRIGVMAFSVIGPSFSSQPGTVRRWRSSDQIRSSGHWLMSSSAGTCRYSRLTWGVRMVCSAKPSGCRA